MTLQILKVAAGKNAREELRFPTRMGRRPGIQCFIKQAYLVHSVSPDRHIYPGAGLPGRQRVRILPGVCVWEKSAAEGAENFKLFLRQCLVD